MTGVAGFTRRFDAPVFNEIAIRVPQGTTASAVLAMLQKHGILGGIDLGRFYPEFADTMLMNATELTTDADIAKLATALATVAKEHELVRA